MFFHGMKDVGTVVRREGLITFWIGAHSLYSHLRASNVFWLPDDLRVLFRPCSPGPTVVRRCTTDLLRGEPNRFSFS